MTSEIGATWRQSGNMWELCEEPGQEFSDWYCYTRPEWVGLWLADDGSCSLRPFRTFEAAKAWVLAGWASKHGGE